MQYRSRQSKTNRGKSGIGVIIGIISIVLAALALVVGVRALTQQEYVLVRPPSDTYYVRGEVRIDAMTVRSYASCRVILHGPTETEASTLPARWATGELEDGKYEVEIRVYARPYIVFKTQVQAVTFSFELDNEVPVPTIEQPQDGQVSELPIEINISTEEGELASVTLDGTVPLLPQNQKALRLSLDHGELGEGQHILQTIAVDAADNKGMREVTFTIDTASPVIVNIGLEAGSFVSGLYLLEPEIVDATPLSFAWSIDGEEVYFERLYSWQTMDLQEGLHTVQLSVEDGLSRTTKSETIEVSIDNTKPRLSWVLQGIGSIEHHPKVPLASHATQLFSAELTTIRYYVDGVEVVGPWLSLSHLNPGSVHTVGVSCIDAAGNSERASVTLHLANGFASWGESVIRSSVNGFLFISATIVEGFGEMIIGMATDVVSTLEVYLGRPIYWGTPNSGSYGETTYQLRETTDVLGQPYLTLSDGMVAVGTRFHPAPLYPIASSVSHVDDVIVSTQVTQLCLDLRGAIRSSPFEKESSEQGNWILESSFDVLLETHFEQVFRLFGIPLRILATIDIGLHSAYGFDGEDRASAYFVPSPVYSIRMGIGIGGK